MSRYDRNHRFFIRLARIILHRGVSEGLNLDLADTLISSVEDWFDENQNEVSMDLVRISLENKS